METFFGLTTCSTESLGILIHNEYKFPSTLSLEVMNTPETANVLGSNLTRTCVFLSGKYSVSKKLSAYYLFAYFLSAYLSHLAVCSFLLYAVFIVVATYVFIYSCNL